MIRLAAAGLLIVLATWHGALCGRAQAAEGSLQLIVRDEKAAAPVQSRLEVWPADQPDQLIALPNTVSAGIGFVVDRRVKLELPAGEYRYQLTRGPEYRVVRGGFSLTNSSRDRKLLYLPRIDDMRSRGWTSGDCCVPGPIQHLPLRMAAVDLHMVGVLRSAGSDMAEDLAGAEPIDQQPRWITDGLASHGGLLFYGTDAIDTKKFPIESILATKDDSETHVAIENPFAWPLPIWLASGQVNGFFVLGDWTRLDQRVEEVPSGRGVPDEIPEDARAVGRWADLIYMRALDAGLRLVPLAGSGNAGGASPLGYNRLYVAGPMGDYQAGVLPDPSQVETETQWWESVWSGHSVATNGPLLRPKLGGEPPGHVFRGKAGDILRLQMEIALAVRDRIEFLEVVHNGRVHYRVRLREFAETNGLIPTIHADESGWVTVRLVTSNDQHWRYATSAPWWIEIEDQPYVTTEAVDFFQQWQREYEQVLRQRFEAGQLSKAELDRLSPFIRYARRFWDQKASIAVPSEGATEATRE